MKGESLENKGFDDLEKQKENLMDQKEGILQKTWTHQKAWTRVFAGKDGVQRLCGGERAKKYRKKVEKVLKNVLHFLMAWFII